MKQTLQLRLGQHLTMTPQLQQAIRLLQLSTLDLKQEIQDALDSNLMLEVEEDVIPKEGTNSLSEHPTPEGSTGDTPGESKEAAHDQEVNGESNTLPEELPVDSSWEDIYDAALPPGGSQSVKETDSDYLSQRRSARTLHDYLTWQLNLTPLSEIDFMIATALVDGINEDGYLGPTLEEIEKELGNEEIDIEEIEAVLHRLQQFDPPGVAARDPQECLLLQLQQYPEPHPTGLKQALILVRDHFQLLAQQDHIQIKRKLKINDARLQEINQLILSLNPRPGTLVSETEAQYVIPDVFVTKLN